MKKIAMMMAGLGVVGGLSSMVWPAVALEGDYEGEVVAEAGAGAGVNAGAEKVEYYWEGAYNTEANIDSPYFEMRHLFPTLNLVAVETRMATKERAMRRLVLVYYDYENGVTEEVADQRLATLGEDDYTDWAVRLAYKEMNLADHPYLTNLTGFDVEFEVEMLENRTDLIYYAVEYGVPTLTEDGETEWTETEWLRGKLDYRQCVHSVDFDLNLVGSAPTCMTKLVEPGKNAVWTIGVQDKNEQVITWDEEWREIQYKRLAAIVQELATWVTEWDEEEVRAMLARLGKLETTLAVANGVEDLLVVERALTEWLQEWLDEQTEEEAGSGDEGADGENGGGAEVEETGGEDEGGETGETGGADVVGGNGGVGVGGATSAGGETTTVGGGMALTNVGTQGEGNQEGGHGATASDVGMGSSEAGTSEKKDMAEGDQGKGDLVEVPALGETEKSGFPWWILVVLLTTGVGMASWLLYGRKRQKEE